MEGLEVNRRKMCQIIVQIYRKSENVFKIAQNFKVLSQNCPTLIDDFEKM